MEGITPRDKAREVLARLPEEQRALALEALDKQRREAHYIRYWRPYPKQADILRQFTGDIKTFGLLGGNRSGKTELGTFLTLAWALGKSYFRDERAWEFVKDLPIPDPPNNIWVVGLDWKVVKDVIWYEKFRTGRDHPPLLPKDDTVVTKTNDSEFQVYFRNGSVITCKSADSGREKFQGASVDLVWIDEEPDVDIYDECYQRTVDCRGKLLITLTPLTDIASGVRNPWVFDLHEDWRSGKKDLHFAYLSVLDNPFVPEDEKERLREKWAGHPEERARLYGEFIQRSGLVYPMWDPKKHFVRPFPIPADWTRIVSVDPAATGVTAAVWCAVHPSGNLFFYREYYERDRIVSEHVKAIKIRNAGDLVDIWLIDPKWGSQRGAEDHRQNFLLYRDAGLPVRLAEVGEDYGLNASREYLNATVIEGARHPKAFFFEGQLPKFDWEITHYTWSIFTKGELKGLSKERPTKRNDHLMNAFQYLCALRPRFRRRSALTETQRREHAQRNSYT